MPIELGPLAFVNIYLINIKRFSLLDWLFCIMCKTYSVNNPLTVRISIFVCFYVLITFLGFFFRLQSFLQFVQKFCQRTISSRKNETGQRTSQNVPRRNGEQYTQFTHLLNVRNCCIYTITQLLHLHNYAIVAFTQMLNLC